MTKKKAAKPKSSPRLRGLRATPPGRLRRDTPVETPAVLIEVPHFPATNVTSALATRPETIEAVYEAWDELREHARRVEAAFGSERARLSEHGALLLGAVQTVVPAAEEALEMRGELETLATEARLGLGAATAELETRSAEARRSLDVALAEVVGEARSRVVRQAAQSLPHVELVVRVLPGERRVLQVRRFSPDAAVTFLFAVSGRIPSRYGFLFDDSTDDVQRAPPSLYGDEGVVDVRPSGTAFVALLESRSSIWPVKGVVPMVSRVGWIRWTQRGSVMEAEIADGETFRNALVPAEAEQILGQLLKLKLEGRIELSLVRD